MGHFSARKRIEVPECGNDVATMPDHCQTKNKNERVELKIGGSDLGIAHKQNNVYDM